MGEPRAGSSGPSRAFRVTLTCLAAAGLLAVGYFLVTGADYYATPIGPRARHPSYWNLKPGGELGLRFGAIGLAMMTLMHAYSARKRLRVLRGKGPLRSWLTLDKVSAVMVRVR